MPSQVLSRTTNLQPGVRLGSQEPRLKSLPTTAVDLSHGLRIVDFMAQIGRPLDPWQAQITIDTFARRADGKWAAKDVVVLVPRQNGKGGITEAQEIGALFLLREKLVLHSAHEFKTSTEAFRRLLDIIDGSDWLTKRVKAISRSKGEEGIELTRAAGGGRLRFVARTAGSGRGFTASRLVFDEAYALTVAQYGAQTPTLATIPNPQITYTSTPPDDQTGPMPEDAMLPSVRRRGQSGDPRMAYYEWSPERGADDSDPDVWYQCNPALGIRIEEEFLADQHRAFTAAGAAGKFSTEHLGEWPAEADEQWQVIGEAEWTDAGDEMSKVEGGIALGIDMSPDRAWTSIAVFGRRADGLRHCQLAEYGAGTAWVVDWVKKAVTERDVCAVVVGANGPARSLIKDLQAARVDVLTPGTADVAGACGSFFDGIAGKDLDGRDIRHRKQGQLTAAISSAAKRKTGDAWLWERLTSAVDVSPAYAVALALYGFTVRPPDDYAIADSVL